MSILDFLLGAIFGGVIVLTVSLTRRRIRLEFTENLRTTLEAFEAGNYETRVFHYAKGAERTELADSFNRMADKLEEDLQDLAQERDVLRHILQNMTTGVVYIDHQGHVQMVNAVAEKLFRRPHEQWEDREHWTVFRHVRLGAAIDNALLFGHEWSSEVTLFGDQVLVVHLVPIISSLKSNRRADVPYDVLLLANDLSEWQRLERMRSDFVANVSHELKTPIAAIQGFAETLLDEEVGDPLQQKFLRTIHEESTRMGHLVSDLLELSKLESAGYHADLVAVDLPVIVARSIDRIGSVARKRNVHVATDRVPKIQVWADENMLLQVLLNLLSNAIAYTPEGGTVTLTVDLLVDRVKVHVKDNGIGMTKEHIPRVFERFYRVNRDRSRASGGTGLGLAIVKHIVTVLGGEVGVESRPGEGSDFWFTVSRLTNGMDRM